MSELVVNGILDALGRLPGWLVWGYFWSKTLDVRGLRSFWFCWMGIWTVTSVLMVFPQFGSGTSCSMVATVLYMVAFPFCISNARPVYRILVIICTAISVLLAEMAVYAFSFIFGFDIPSDFRHVLDHPTLYATCEAILALILAVELHSLYMLFLRIGDRQTNPVLRYYGMGLLAQLALTVAMLSVAQWVLWENQAVIFAAGAFVAVNIAADGLILLLLSRANAAYAQNQRARLLRSRLDATLAAFKGLADEVQAVARFRHDLRAELQAAASLVRAGEYARAEALVDGLEHRIAPGQGGETR